MPSTSLHGRRVAITGGARGIGLATARELYRRGATVIIGDLDGELAHDAARTLGPDVQASTLDVSDHASFSAFHRLAVADGPLDVLINNAGILSAGSFVEQSADVHRRSVETNVLGCIFGMHVALPEMLERRQGHIVNVASTAGKGPVPGGLTYCGTKSAVIALTETARVEYAASGVQFTCVMPHFTKTELIAGTTPTKLIPPATPDDVGYAIAEAIGNPRPDVYVPQAVQAIVALQPLLHRRVRDVALRMLGVDRAFQHIDQNARAGYAHRIGE